MVTWIKGLFLCKHYFCVFETTNVSIISVCLKQTHTKKNMIMSSYFNPTNYCYYCIELLFKLRLTFHH